MKVIKNITANITNLLGKPMFVDEASQEEAKVNNFIASTLISQAQSADPVRALKLAIKLNDASDTLEIEDADYQMILEAVKSNKNYSNLVAGRILEILLAAESK